jgi:N-methylhydantoinase A
VVCFDMGGTSCDVCLVEDGRVPETAERAIAGRPVALAALDIHTVGAGGGSIAWRDAGGALRVGPLSAGAEPGPACYGRGGTRPTVTDANLLLGRLLEDSPLAGELRLDLRAAERAVASLAKALGLAPLACAEGIVAVAESEMLGALRVITVERGIDPRGFGLMPFGGAGPLHAAALADQLGIATVLCPRASGVLSALGLAAAAPRRDAARTVMLSGEELTAERLERERSSLAAEAREALPGAVSRLRMSYELRYRGQSFELAVEREEREPTPTRPPTPDELRESFDDAHESRYGYRDERAGLELVNIRASAWGAAPVLAPRAAEVGATVECRQMTYRGELVAVTVLRGEPAEGTRIEGPALCALPDSTLLVPPGWSGSVDRHGTITLSRKGG